MKTGKYEITKARGTKVCASLDFDGETYALTVDESVKVSEHFNRFHDFETMDKYLVWLLGSWKAVSIDE